jgi:hypothetical protein
MKAARRFVTLTVLALALATTGTAWLFSGDRIADISRFPSPSGSMDLHVVSLTKGADVLAHGARVSLRKYGLDGSSIVSETEVFSVDSCPTEDCYDAGSDIKASWVGDDRVLVMLPKNVGISQFVSWVQNVNVQLVR